MTEAVFAGTFGLLIGSFLNVCIYRLPRDLSVVSPRSFCPGCERQIAATDNVPVFSWLLLRGRCRYCRTRISARYPAVELLTALLFFFAIQRFGPTPLGWKMCVFAAIQVALVFTDFEERILPDEFTLGGTVVGIVLALWVFLPESLAHLLLPSTWQPQVLSVAEAVLGALAPSLTLWAAGALYHAVRKREGLGLGDVKMVAAIGAFLGLSGALLTLIAGSLLGSVIGIVFIAITRKDSATYELPFGSFLGFAALLVAFSGRF
ncbi:MAG TPA: prepilin peptidase [Bryobacteraceae bacterium]|nr:prepilin peptidase [Bryobacteraceae bacterium]